MNLVVRDLEISDLDSLLSLYRHLHEADPSPDAAAVNQVWRGVMADPNLIYMGGFVDGQLVSACSAAIIPNLTRGAKPYALIENVVTDANYRRQGIGSGVMRRLVARCFDRGCYKVMLMSGTGRSEIHGFYEAIGFDKGSKQAFIIRV